MITGEKLLVTSAARRYIYLMGLITFQKALLIVPCCFFLGVAGAIAGNDRDSANTDCGAEAALIRLEESYRRCGPITFAFEQRTTSAVFGDETRQTGRAWFDPSGRFRVETAQETFIKNGDTLWHWIPAYNQVTIRVVDSASQAGWPTDFLWTLRRDFLPLDCREDTLDGAVLHKVRATAKTNTAAIQRLTIWIDTATYFVRQAEYVDYNDDRVDLNLTRAVIDTLDASLRYSSQFPDSVEVIIFPQK